MNPPVHESLSHNGALYVYIRLDVYIHDYLVKRDLKATAQAFQAEGKVSSDPVGKNTRMSNCLMFASLYSFSCYYFLSFSDSPQL